MIVTSKATGRTYEIDARGLATEVTDAEDYFDEAEMAQEAALAAWEATGRDRYRAWDLG